MKENNYVVYRHTSPSGKVYIGITCTKPEKRWRNGNGYKNCSVFYRAIQKYGWNNIEHQILFSGLNEISAKMIEEDLIYYYKKEGISYNITDGGDGVKGYHHTEERKRKISSANKGRKLSEETKRRMSKAKKNLSAETREKMSTSQKCKSVSQYFPNGTLFATYKSLSEAERLTNISTGSISQCCRGLRKTAGGFIWRYEK